ncbi:MAG: hypothetical protein DRO67_02300 [Candidatus Asgardarchaeum californiense]|nr:MAG: hypothetical protein DRO67_02300 [Candidatus Asgardarchaeum californiense]
MTVDVVAIGNANIDLILLAEKFPKRDEKVIVREINETPGGSAGNFATGMSRLGVKTGFIGKIGDDEYGKKFIESLLAENIDVSQIKKVKEVRTGMTVIINTVRGGHVLYAYRGANNLLGFDDFNLDYIGKAKVFHLASINKKLLEAAIKTREKVDTKLSLDPGRQVLKMGLKKLESSLKYADFLFMNVTEFQLLTGKSPASSSIKELAERLDAIVSIQRGKHGSIVSDGKQVIEIPAFKVNVVDTTGAGDAYAVGFIFAALKNESIYKCGVYGNAVAAMQITKVGGRNGLPTVSELEQFLAQNVKD